MGYAEVFGPYHKGPKKNKRARKCTTPSFDKPKPKPLDSKPSDAELVRLVAQMDTKDMTAFVCATSMPNPKDVVLSVSGGRVRPVVIADSDRRQTNRGMVYVAAGGVGAATVEPKQHAPQPPHTDPDGEIVGYIVRKPNGELVLKMN